MRVFCEIETKVIAEMVKGTQYFYVKNHLWPNGGVKTTTYLSRIQQTLSLTRVKFVTLCNTRDNVTHVT